MNHESAQESPAAPQDSPQPNDARPIACSASESFAEFMARCGGSLAVTTYQAGKVALIGIDEQRRRVTLLLRHFDKPMGLAIREADGARPRSLALATRHEVLLLADAPLLAGDYLEAEPGKYDALYLPRAAYFTGDLNVHDLAFDTGGTLWLANTRFGCLSSLSEHFSFVPHWKPPFVSELAPEDRCHLNGIGVVEGAPRYVTCLGETDTAGGWRTNKAAGGVVINVQSNEVVLRGLCMPHSPRWHEGTGKLWLLNSGTGEVLCVNPSEYKPQVVCALPGYIRGLCFVGEHHAVVGLSQIRERHIFGGLPVQEPGRWPKLLCGVAVVDLRTGRQEAFFEFTSGVQELYEVAFVPGVRQPALLNTERQASRDAFTAPKFSYWLRPSAMVRDRS